MKYIFGSWKKGWKIATLVAVIVVVLLFLHFGDVVNINPQKWLERKPLTERQQVAKDSLRRVDSIATVQAEIAKAQKRAEADSIAAQETIVTTKKNREPLTLGTFLNDLWGVMVAVFSFGFILTVFYLGKKPSGFFNQVFDLAGKIMFSVGILYFIGFAFYMRNQKVQKIPFYADESRIRWVIDSTAMANPKQVVYAPDTASFRIIDSLTNELLAYQRDNMTVQVEQGRMIDSLQLVITDLLNNKESIVSKKEEVEEKTVTVPEKKKAPVAVKKKKKSPSSVARRDRRTEVYAPGSSGLSRSVQ